MLRNIILNQTNLSSLIQEDIGQGLHDIVKLANRECEHQKKQVKKQKRKHIQVDYNVLYCWLRQSGLDQSIN
jgi:hypothetical protein